MFTRSSCRYCGHDIGYITVYGRRKAVETYTVPYTPKVRGYAYKGGWIDAQNGWPAPAEVVPRHPCALVEDLFDLDDLRIGDDLDDLITLAIYGDGPLGTVESA